jgi:hypothetical protein
MRGLSTSLVIWLKSDASPPNAAYPDDEPPCAEVDPLASVEFGDDRALQEIDCRQVHRFVLPDTASKDPIELAGSSPDVQSGAQ